MHQFDTLKNFSGGAEELEPQQGPDDSFHSPMVLFHLVIQVLDLMDLDGGTTAAEPITSHKTFSVRFLSVARNGSLVYGYRGEIWRRPAGSKESRRVPIRMT